MSEPAGQIQTKRKTRWFGLAVVVSAVLGGASGATVGGLLGNNNAELLAVFGDNPPPRVNLLGAVVPRERATRFLFEMGFLWSFVSGAVSNWVVGRLRGVTPGRSIHYYTLSGQSKWMWVNVGWEHTVFGMVMWFLLQVSLILATVMALWLNAGRADPAVVGPVGGGGVGLLLGVVGGWITVVNELRHQKEGSGHSGP
jgi:hypothetical protein